MGAKTGAAVVHAAKMPTQYILAMESMQVQRDGAMVAVKMLPAFTAKRSPGCSSDVLHDSLEGTQMCRWWWYGPVGKTWSTYLSMRKLRKLKQAFTVDCFHDILFVCASACSCCFLV